MQLSQEEKTEDEHSNHQGSINIHRTCSKTFSFKNLTFWSYKKKTPEKDQLQGLFCLLQIPLME